MEFVHVSVMPEEVISWAPQDARLIVDGTAGEAGHTLLLARRCPNARILAFDRDPEMLERARKKLGLAGMENRVELIRGSFGEIPEHTREADFILLDLGVSMHHFRG
ncbi:MAG TPA: 16S rRNA (cytosine(1402)-N(4))-methyltransferase, partial [Leptospiraceae bacterium]|nr:16S rRNA (cytosine(1402)-N(4))-methyltransferase [Leptospiraceae bacterium]